MSFGSDMQIDRSQGADISENPYYKKIRKELREKNDVAKIEADHAEQVRATKEPILKAEEHDDHFKDKITLSAYEWEEAFNDESSSDDLKKEKQKQLENLKMDGEKIRRLVGQKIDFSQRMPQLKDLFRHNLIESRSQNQFKSRFAQFKVGVIGQILSAMGVPIEELKKLKKKALKEAYDENVENMAENIYNQEITELFFGTGKRTKKTLEMYNELQVQLMGKMNRIGPVGYWSKVRMLEEKLAQCKKIYDEFMKEKMELEYQIDYQEQVLS